MAVGVATMVVGGAACATGQTTTGTDATSLVVSETLQSRVEAALTTAADVDAKHLVVSATDGVVTLIGQVGSGFEQQSVGAIVRAVPGVDEVRFRLEVEDPQAGR